ncbi:MAG: hypothetical protein KatS3mg121_0467 [Gammaproteobacteria bacterium]|nr:MAG: hypothetical protein KatS3mg121_0467 [Gammaproteobacteria bacterium]
MDRPPRPLSARLPPEWRRRLSEQRALWQALQAALPPEWRRPLCGAALDGTALVLFVPSAAWATRLRYSERTLLPPLSAALGRPIERLRVRVAPPLAPAPAARGAAAARRPAPPPPETGAVLATLADKVGHPALARALRRLARRR